MKRFIALTLLLLISACAQSGDGLVQEPIPDPNPNPQPDPIITTPIDSRFVGQIKAAATGAGQNATYDFDSILEFREKQGGKWIGYSRLWDKLQQGTDGKPKLIVDYWAQGQRTNADVQVLLNLNPSCADLRLKGKLDAAGNLSLPKTTQRIGCGIFVSISVVTEATVLTRQGATSWTWWPKIEAYFSGK